LGRHADNRSSASRTRAQSVPIPLYDPVYYTIGKHERTVRRSQGGELIGFFLEAIQQQPLYGRIIPIGGIIDKNYPMNPGAFPKAIRLVE
jgi:hypothetical protein